MQVVLVFKQKIYGYKLICTDRDWKNEFRKLENRLYDYIRSNAIQVERIVEKSMSIKNIRQKFLGFVPKEASFSIGDLLEEDIETGKYLRAIYSGNNFGIFETIEKMRKYMGDNNIRSDGLYILQYSKMDPSIRKKNLYLRIKN